MVPNRKGFSGQVHVLVSGKTFSAGASFALFCKNANIPLVGEEIGGGYYTQTGGYPVLYTLPNSGIKILISFVKIDRFVVDKTIKKGSGIPVDVEVPLALEDLIQGKDGPLEYILKQIGQQYK